MHVMHRHACRQNTNTHEMIFLLKKICRVNLSPQEAVAEKQHYAGGNRRLRWSCKACGLSQDLQPVVFVIKNVEGEKE